MKRILASMAIIAMMAVMPVQAQGVKFGVKGGINITSMKFDQSVFNSKNRMGWFIGPVLKVSILSGFGIDIAALYDQRETKINDESIKQKSVLIPLNSRLNLGLGSTAGIYLAAGPQFGFNIGKKDFKWDKDNVENTFQLKKSSLSINLGAGVFVTKHFEMGFTYNIVLGKTGDATFKSAINAVTDKSTYTEEGTKAKVWTLSACVYF